MPLDVYEELAYDLVTECGLDLFSARKVVKFLESEGHIDYDALKEHYLYGDEEC